MNILITGHHGFVGSTLVEYIFATYPDAHIFGLSRRKKTMPLQSGLIEEWAGDMTDSDLVSKIITQTRPEKIFHLAAQSIVPQSWQSPSITLHDNIIGQSVLLEAIRSVRAIDHDYNPVVLIAGSSEEYGLVTEADLPITEDTPLRPLSPYGVSKVCQDLLGFQYWRVHGIKTIRTRAFNQSGPRRGDVYVDSNFAKQIASIEKGLQPPKILTGNLDARRDLMDVRDVVIAYWLATERCVPGDVYNICSGTAHSIQEIVDRLLALSTRTDITVETDPARLRPADVPVIVGDPSKFFQATGWAPTYNYLEQTLPDLLNYWREQL